MSQQQLCIFHINKNITLNIKYKCQDSKDLDAINADDEIVESLFHDNRANDNFNLNSLIYTNAYDYPIPDNIPNTSTGIYKFWKAIIFTTTEESFNLA